MTVHNIVSPKYIEGPIKRHHLAHMKQEESPLSHGNPIFEKDHHNHCYIQPQLCPPTIELKIQLLNPTWNHDQAVQHHQLNQDYHETLCL